jgi:3-methyladenine DNA glycosylase AlkD
MHEILPYKSGETDEMVLVRRWMIKRMNGVTASKMKENGIVYPRNYGVALPEIRLMAEKLPHTCDMADRLWNEKIRETLLLATLIYPAAQFSKEKAEEWLRSVDNMEMVEQISRNLISKLDYLESAVFEWIHSDNSWVFAVGFYAVALADHQFDFTPKAMLEKVALTAPQRNTMQGSRAVALFLRKAGCINKEEAQRILKQTEPFSRSGKDSEHFIYEEVKTDLTYRFGL